MTGELAALPANPSYSFALSDTALSLGREVGLIALGSLVECGLPAKADKR